MKNIIITLITILILGSCSDEPTSKYANAEECAFKESKDCEDKSCTSLAYSYCQKSFVEINAQKQALDKTCREYKAKAQSCFSPPKKCERDEEGATFSEIFKNSICQNAQKTYLRDCSEEAISKRNKFIKSKCN